MKYEMQLKTELKRMKQKNSKSHLKCRVNYFGVDSGSFSPLNLVNLRGEFFVAKRLGTGVMGGRVMLVPWIWENMSERNPGNSFAG